MSQPYLSFIKEHYKLYRTVIEKPSVFSTDKTYEKMFQDIFNPILNRFSVEPSERNYMMMSYLKGISAIVEEWIKGNCSDDTEHIISIIQKCIMQNTDNKKQAVE